MPVAGDPVPNAIGTGSAARSRRLRRGWWERTGYRSLQERFLSGEVSLNVHPPPCFGLGCHSELDLESILRTEAEADTHEPWKTCPKPFAIHPCHVQGTCKSFASRRRGTLYIGVTSGLNQRIWRHRQGIGSGFTAQYGVTRLVYYEAYDDMQTAIEREKQLKGWRRAWKIELIETKNPTWDDLYVTI